MALNDRHKPVYMIGVAAELAGVHPQTLRSYEQKGLLTPQRTSGNTRMYSQADIERQLDAGAFLMSREEAVAAGFLNPYDEQDTVIVNIREEQQ